MLNKKISVVLLIIIILLFSTSSVFATTQAYVFDYDNYSDGNIVLYNDSWNLIYSDAQNRGIDLYSRPYTVVVYPDRMLFYSCNIRIHTFNGTNFYFTPDSSQVYIWNVLFNGDSPSIDDFVNVYCNFNSDWTVANSDSYILCSSQDVYDYINNVNITGLKTMNQLYSQGFFLAPTTTLLMTIRSPELVSMTESKVLGQILGVLPLIMVVVVSFLGLRKALTMLSGLFHKA